MVQTWKSGDAGEFECPSCGSMYRRIVRRLPARDEDQAECEVCKTPLKELTRSRKFQQPALANLWKSIGKSFLRKRMAGHMALMPRAVTR